jgi:hypothetical protein
MKHGSELLATISDAQGDRRRPSASESIGLLAGGLRRRSMEACAGGPIRGTWSALRGIAAASLLWNAIVQVVGLEHLRRGWVTRATAHLAGGLTVDPGFLLTSRHELGNVAVAQVTPGLWQWSAIALAVLAVAVLAAGFWRLAGGVLLASGLCAAGASNWLTGLGIRNPLGWWTAWGGIPFVSNYGGDVTYTSRLVDPSIAATVVIPALLLLALPHRDGAGRQGWAHVSGWLAALAALILAFVTIPWLWQDPGAALLGAVVVAGVALGRLDGRIAVAAGALVMIDLGLLQRAWQWTAIGNGQGPGIWLSNGDRITIPWIPALTLVAVLLAVWGVVCMRRRTPVVGRLAG